MPHEPGVRVVVAGGNGAWVGRLRMALASQIPQAEGIRQTSMGWLAVGGKTDPASLRARPRGHDPVHPLRVCAQATGCDGYPRRPGGASKHFDADAWAR